MEQLNLYSNDCTNGVAMIITNNQNLPKPFVDAVSRNYEYKDKRYSVTSILKGYRENLLTRRYANQIEQDCADSIWMIFGTAVHKVLEESNADEHLLKELKLEMKLQNGYVLSGIIDLYDTDNKEVIDYKTGSVWKVKFDDWKDYRKQLLYYAVLLKANGYECHKAKNVMLLKDHSKRESKISSDYPEYPVYTKEYTFTSQEIDQAEQEIREIFNCLESLENALDSELPICTDEQRWAKPDKWAVMRKGVKKAVRVLDSQEQAEEYLTNSKGDYIEFRKGEDSKCLEYCSCNKYCSYYKEKYGKDSKE